MLSDVVAREVFHVLLLEHLTQQLGQRLVLKGGVNLRLFFGSPRYSQDIDFDAAPDVRSAAKAAISKSLRDPYLRRRFVQLGGGDIRLPDKPSTDTETTLRYKFGVVTSGGIDLPTKIEVSFRPRPALDTAIIEGVASALVDGYRSPADIRSVGVRARGATPALPLLMVPHYGRLPAIRQKIGALALRTEIQSRDIFDLGVLDAVRLDTADAVLLRKNLTASVLREAAARALEIPFAAYRDEVLAYLDPADRSRYDTDQIWDDLSLSAYALAEQLRQLSGPSKLPWYRADMRPEPTGGDHDSRTNVNGGTR
jgi:hypothetical protein